jgi:uncharacterized membrane protein
VTALALLLVLCSAGLHVVQHVALKRACNRMAFLWWMWLWAAVLFLPVPILMWRALPPLVWGLLAISAVFETLYYLSIARAYRTGDLSLVYPLARGVAPMLICLWTALAWREHPSLGGALGIALIVVGLWVVNLRRTGARQPLEKSCVRWALLAGLCISLYTTIDKAGVGHAPALLYTYIAMTLTLVYLTPAALATVGWKGLRMEWRASKLPTLVAGGSAMAAYAIVLFVMQNGAQASYVSATREISVVFGTVLGAVVFKESATAMRVLGAVLITLGVAVTGLLA